MTDAISSATGGMLAAARRFDLSAARVARLGTDVPGADAVDLATEITGQIEDQTAFAVNAKVVKAGTDMQKRLLDVLA